MVAEEMRSAQYASFLNGLIKIKISKRGLIYCKINLGKDLNLTSFSPDNTSKSARSLVPSLKSSIKSSILSGGTRCK